MFSNVMIDFASTRLKGFWEWLGELVAPLAAYIPFMKQPESSKNASNTKKKDSNTPGGARWETTTNNKVLVVDCKQTFNEILAQSKAENFTIVANFTATWCAPCQKLKPVIKATAAATPAVCFLQLDVDENQEVAEKYEISALPAFKVFSGGEVTDSWTGGDSESKLRELAATN